MLAVLFSFLGFLFLVLRLKPWQRLEETSSCSSSELVSIILPCRNEQDHIAGILESLFQIDYPNKEIIVVDDSSTDETAVIARKMGATVIEAGPKPESWCGKNWACWQGAQFARGAFLLFTDADTRHRSHSLKKMVGFQRKTQAELISCPPRYSLKLWGEDLLGFFYHLPLLITAYRQAPKAGRVYAIGQYLFFKRDAYFEIGGHEVISKSLVDDIDLAERAISNNLTYAVYPHSELYEVQMYASYQSFLKGWRRLLRLGMKRSSALAFFEIFCLFHLLLIGPLRGELGLLLLASCGYLFFAFVQKQQGPFSAWGALLIPFNILLFIFLTVMALKDKLFRQAVIWHDRAYAER